MSATTKLKPGVDRDRNLIICQKPDAIVVRLYEVLGSWKKNTLEMITYVKDHLLHFINKKKDQIYVLQVLAELRQQSLNDRKLIKNCPIVEPLTSDILDVAKSARKYISWKFNLDGNVDIGSTKQAHNRICRMVSFEGYRGGKLPFYLYHEVKQALEVWKSQGIHLVCYSSMACDEIWEGNNLLAYTSYGDLQDLFENYIDTSKSPVTVDKSYQSLLEKYGANAKILFITADLNEARIAQKNNINPMVIIREEGLINISNQYFDDIPCIIQLNELKFVKESEIQKLILPIV